MAQRVNPKLKKELSDFGIKEWNDCYHCGNCTAVCSLTEQDVVFPRKDIRLLQMGLKQKLSLNVEPWLCYYCGDCSTTCPRDANPAERMMSLRRYLTSVYDWTGLSKLFYTIKSLHLLSFLILGIIILIITLYSGREVFALGHTLEQYFVGVVALFIIVPGVFRMYWFSVVKDKTIKVPFGAYISSLFDFVFHAATQKKILKCEKSAFAWLRHWIVAVGYIVMLVMFVFFDWIKTAEGPSIAPKIVAYLVIGLMTLFSGIILITRATKKEQVHKFSELSDWLFPIWLFLLGLTALIAYFLKQTGNHETATIIYIIHIIVITQWALLIVPFSKWTHIAYRPMAIYISKLKKKGRK
ncbi:MAG: 4Fe-4S dicluster domain-containing protein [Bacteroidota bacterium]